MYTIRLTKNAERDVVRLQRYAPATIKKLATLIEELKLHPRSGTGQAEQLKHFVNETWSRRINREHRLVYEIHENEVLVLVISTFGHYNNK